MRAAFFDLDKTLVRVNTGPLYVRWRIRRRQMSLADLARVSWWSLEYTLGVLDADAVSRAAASTLAGVQEATFRAECAEWVLEEVLPQVTDVARAELSRRREEGFVCALLTGTSPYVAEPVAEALGVEHVLCSRVRVREGRFTGELEPPLCYGPGKVARARRWAGTHGADLSRSVFYTDSVTDLPMLEAVGEPRVVNPDPRLERVARRRGWTVERWTR
ncbi:MAG TPA: HAD family hydrolase [Sandaracinaceae bacterium LLY-WYZ-13_1]|nr:HAD family hydrolase [Sandaracinaceae bacterium LLY-WYZ-13_1]